MANWMTFFDYELGFINVLRLKMTVHSQLVVDRFISDPDGRFVVYTDSESGEDLAFRIKIGLKSNEPETVHRFSIHVFWEPKQFGLGDLTPMAKSLIGERTPS